MSAALAAARALAAPRGPARILPARVRGAALRAAVGLLLRTHRLDELLERLAAPAPRPSPPTRAGGEGGLYPHPLRGPGKAEVAARGLASGERSGRPHAPHEALAGLRRLPVTCLHRALAGYAALRAAGEDARFVIGVARAGDEVLAHAWLEQGGAPVGEPTDPRARFAVAWVHPPAPEGRQEERSVASTVPSQEILLTRLGDGTGVLLHLGTKFYYTLNRTGVVAWEVISKAQRVDPEAIVDALVARFAGVDRVQARADVDALLRELEGEGLLAHGS